MEFTVYKGQVVWLENPSESDIGVYGRLSYQTVGENVNGELFPITITTVGKRRRETACIWRIPVYVTLYDASADTLVHLADTSRNRPYDFPRKPWDQECSPIPAFGDAIEFGRKEPKYLKLISPITGTEESDSVTFKAIAVDPVGVQYRVLWSTHAKWDNNILADNGLIDHCKWFAKMQYAADWGAPYAVEPLS